MSKQTIESEYYYRLREISKLKPSNVAPKLEEFLKEVTPKKGITGQQNRALHKDCSLIAEKLNDMGLGMREVLKPSFYIEWSTESIKKYLWKPIQLAITGKKSTTELLKLDGKIELIHDTIMRELGEKFKVEYHEFPSDKKRHEEELAPPKFAEIKNYPDEELKPKF